MALSTRIALETLTDRERRWLDLIATHGPLTSAFLFEANRHTHRCKDTALRNLQRLREDGWLCLPPQQQQIAKANFNPHVYDLTISALREVESHIGCKPIRPSGHWWHGFMVSSCTAALSIEAQKARIGFLPTHLIGQIKENGVAITSSKGRVIPDQVFALRYQTGFCLCALEVDRGTEPFATSAHRKSIKRSISQYQEICSRGLHRDVYGVKSPLLVLWVFTSKSRQEAFLEYVSSTEISRREQFLVQYLAHGFPRYAEHSATVCGEWRRVKGDGLSLCSDHNLRP